MHAAPLPSPPRPVAAARAPVGLLARPLPLHPSRRARPAPAVGTPDQAPHRRPHRPRRLTTPPPVSAASGDASASSADPPSSPPPPTTRARLWYAALKPPMYAVALAPVAVGGAAAIAAATAAAAAAASGNPATPLPWPLLRAALATLAHAAAGAAAVIAWLNLSNDAWDAATGVDVAKPESVVNLLGGRVAPVHAAAAAALVAGLSWLGGALRAAGCRWAWWSAAGGGDPRPALLLTLAIAAGYVYQGPPFRLSYVGAGEPLCFTAFGPAATTAFYLVGARALAVRGASAASIPLTTPAAAVAATLVGLTTTAVLFCSHFHQAAGDAAAGKRSPLVRLGGDTAAAAGVLAAGVVGTYAVLGASAALGWLPLPAAATAAALSLPPARKLLGRAAADHAVPARARTLKLAALDWHGGLGAGLALGLAGPAVLASARAAGIV